LVANDLRGEGEEGGTTVKESTISEILRISATFAWIFGIIGLLRGSFMGLLILILAGVLTYMSVTNTRERRHREMVEATRNRKDDDHPDGGDAT
jgi:hypothetical protein